MSLPLGEQQEYHYTGDSHSDTGGKYYCSYYSRQGDRWQFEIAN